MTGSFLAEPALTPEVQAAYDNDVADDGYVWNVTRLWAHHLEFKRQLFDLMSAAVKAGELSFRQRGILVTATASSLGDSYCSFAWGGKLAGEAGGELAASVLAGDDVPLTAQERAMAAWARKVVREPNATTAADVQELRDVGLTDQQIFAMTTFVSLRLAFSTVNDALGAQPDARLVHSLPPEVVEVVSYGRAPAG